MKRFTLSLFALAISAAPVLAGPAADFENALGKAYADYRTALFMTNTGKADESAKAVASITEKWTAITMSWGSKPPPQYEDDAKWRETLQAVTDISAKAASEIEAKKLSEAHVTLEGIREQISELHQRNGIQSFSDRMNSYHAVMEEVLGTDLTKTDDAARNALHRQAAVLSYLADQLNSHAPESVASSAEFQQLEKSLSDSVAAFLTATEAMDANGLKAAISGLKPAYAKLFLKFG